MVQLSPQDHHTTSSLKLNYHFYLANGQSIFGK